MRYSLALLALAACGAIAAPISAQGQPSVAIPVTKQVRIDLVNSVLRDRNRLFHQPSLINGCALSEAVGAPDEDFRERIDAEFRDGVRGKPRSCLSGFGETVEENIVVLRFYSFHPEHSEYVNPVDPHLGHRPTGMIVVRVGVARRGLESQTEEWVMIQARPSVWRVMTVRIFGIGAG